MGSWRARPAGRAPTGRTCSHCSRRSAPKRDVRPRCLVNPQSNPSKVDLEDYRWRANLMRRAVVVVVVAVRLVVVVVVAVLVVTYIRGRL